MNLDFPHTEKELKKFGDKVVKSAKKNLKQRGPLYNSIRYTIKLFPRSFAFAILMADYGKFQDQGVKGHGRGNWTPKRSKRQQAPRSKFKFRTGPGSKTILKSMVEKPNFRTRDLDSGRFTPKTTANKNQAAFLISRSIGRFGVKPKRFMQDAISSHGKTLAKNLSTAWVADQSKFINGLRNQYLK